jgi:hypothetical protein
MYDDETKDFVPLRPVTRGGPLQPSHETLAVIRPGIRTHPVDSSQKNSTLALHPSMYDAPRAECANEVAARTVPELKRQQTRCCEFAEPEWIVDC